jgi:hypothetical protein
MQRRQSMQRRQTRKKFEDSLDFDLELKSGGIDDHGEEKREDPPSATFWHMVTATTAARLLLLMVLLVLATICYGWKTPDLMLLLEIDSNELAPCAYSQLEEAFRKPRTPSSSSSSHQEQEQDNDCSWKLEHEILRIPMDAVVNRNSLEKLGHGYKGGVHKAILRIANAERSDTSVLKPPRPEDYCTAAVKTDHCHSLTSNVFFDRSERSCLQPWSFLWNDASYLGGEYTGALVFHALLKSQQVGDHPGILPTWAMIQDTKYPLASRLPRRWLQGSPHPDASFKGIIMPLMDFTPLDRLTQGQLSRLVQNTTYLAHMMLPAAKGLVFVNHLGLAFQDILRKNIGIRNDWRHAFIYDYTYLALQKEDTCPKDLAECQFCPEAVFVAANYTDHRVGNKGALTSDMIRFRRILLWLLGKVGELGKRQASTLKQSLEQCISMRQIVEVLQRHAKLSLSSYN